MDREYIKLSIITAIKSVLGETNVNNEFVFSEDTRLFQTGLEFSSIDGVMLIVSLEEIFDIKWPDEYLSFNDVLSIGEIIDVVEKCILKDKINNVN